MSWPTSPARGYSLEYGARNLTRVLKKELLEKIAYLSLEKEWEDSRFLVCCLQDDEIEIIPEAAAAALSAGQLLAGAKEE